MFLIGQSYGLRLRSALLRRPFPCTPISFSPPSPSRLPYATNTTTSTPSPRFSSTSSVSSHLRHFLCFAPLPNVAIIKSIRYTYDRIRGEFKYRFGIRVRGQERKKEEERRITWRANSPWKFRNIGRSDYYYRIPDTPNSARANKR